MTPIPGPRTFERHTAAVLHDLSERSGHLVLCSLRFGCTNHHHPSKPAVARILPVGEGRLGDTIDQLLRN